ncbi:MAG: phosphatidylinositol-3-phosphatase [Candidatus Velthaea sp.]
MREQRYGMKRVIVLSLVVLVALGAAAGWYFRSTRTRFTAVPAVPAGNAAASLHVKPPRSVIIVIEENKSDGNIIGDADSATYIATLAKRGALFTKSYGVAHPSQPNYFALFAGQTTANGDSCPAAGIARSAPNLASELLAAHRTFTAYSEDLPSAGFTGCLAGEYARKHAPWTHFSNIPQRFSVPFSQLRAYDTLPTVAFIIPNLLDDMHSASIERGDAWLRDHLEPIVAWANSHDTLIILTWDESSSALGNHIATIFIGPMVKPGRYDEPITHYTVLRTVEDLYALPHAGRSADVAPIADIWK